MTVERESRRSDVYLGDGRNTSLPFGFKVFLPTEIAVVLNEGGVERTLSHGHGCTVSLNAEQDIQPGGTVRLDTPLPAGGKAVVLSNVRPLQQVDLTNQGGFYPDVLNAVHDRLTMLIQQLMELQARTPQVPATDDATAEDLSRQILELSRSIPEMRRLLQSGDVARLLDILRRNPLLRATELSSAVDSPREDVAATSKAVKIAYDKAVSAAAAALTADGKAEAANETAARLALPSGAVLYFAGQTAPAGWLKANGAAVSRTLYAALFAAIGTTYGAGDGSTTFNLPDLRGEFLRGWDDGRGVDNGRVFGSAQSDAIRNIKGSLESLYGSYRYTLYTKADGAFTTDSDDGVNTTFRSSNDDHANRQKRVVFDASRSVPTAAENRPRNLALLACIKI